MNNRFHYDKIKEAISLFHKQWSENIESCPGIVFYFPLFRSGWLKRSYVITNLLDGLHDRIDYSTMEVSLTTKEIKALGLPVKSRWRYKHRISSSEQNPEVSGDLEYRDYCYFYGVPNFWRNENSFHFAFGKWVWVWEREFYGV